MSNKKTAVYVRVSSDNGRQTTDNQMGAINAWLDSQGIEERDTVIFEDEFTGKTMDRPGWKACWRTIEAGEVHTLLVWKLDRLGRTASGMAKLIEELPKNGVNLVSIQDNIDLSNPAGRLLANIISSVAAYEVEVMSERIKAGMAARGRA